MSRGKAEWYKAPPVLEVYKTHLDEITVVRDDLLEGGAKCAFYPIW
jgi:hypothetical protein